MDTIFLILSFPFRFVYNFGLTIVQIVGHFCLGVIMFLLGIILLFVFWPWHLLFAIKGSANKLTSFAPAVIIPALAILANWKLPDILQFHLYNSKLLPILSNAFVKYGMWLNKYGLDTAYQMHRLSPVTIFMWVFSRFSRMFIVIPLKINAVLGYLILEGFNKCPILLTLFLLWILIMVAMCFKKELRENYVCARTLSGVDDDIFPLMPFLVAPYHQGAIICKLFVGGRVG